MKLNNTILKLNVGSEFQELTDYLITKVKEKNISFENRNFLLAKVPVKEDSKALIITTQDHKRIESYKSGVGRVIATPRILDPEQDANPRVGDYVIYTHESKYALNEPVVNFMFDLNMEVVEDMETLVCIRDVDVIAVVGKDALK